jgi:hypothetical protein
LTYRTAVDVICPEPETSTCVAGRARLRRFSAIEMFYRAELVESLYTVLGSADQAAAGELLLESVAGDLGVL